MKNFALFLFFIVISACTSKTSAANPSINTPQVDQTNTSTPAGARLSIPQQASWQIQYTGDMDYSLDVDVYNLDLFEIDAATISQLHEHDIFVMCYFSAGSYEDWRPDISGFHPDILGNDMAGWPGEEWLDIRQLAQITPIMEARLDV